MTTELRHPAQALEREVGPGGEEVFELEKGVRVRKSGGVEFAQPLSPAELDSRNADTQAQIEHQKAIIARAREESINASRQANEQEILAREATEFKMFNKRRQAEAAQEARSLLVEVNALVEREKELERDRASAHHAAVEKEKERVQAKTSEIMAREEAIEAERRELFHRELIRRCQGLTMKFKLEEEQAKLKLESLQYSLQHGEFRQTAAATKAKIIVEVEPRDIPEARQFDTAQPEPSIASAEMAEEGVPTVAETRTIEEIVSAERGKVRHGTGIYVTPRGTMKAEEIYGERAARLEALAEEQVAPVPPVVSPTTAVAPGPTTPSEIKVLPDIKPTTAPSEPGGVIYAGTAPPPAQPQMGGPYPPSSQQMPATHAPTIAQPQMQQPPVQQAAQPQPPAPEQPATTEKKGKAGGFFKKFGKTK